MNIKLPLSLAALLISMPALADCGYLPSAPALLEASQLSSSQTESLESDMEGYFNSLELFKACIADESTALVPANATEDLFNDPVYQAKNHNLSQILELAESQMVMAIDRHNVLLELPLAEEEPSVPSQ